MIHFPKVNSGAVSFWRWLKNFIGVLLLLLICGAGIARGEEWSISLQETQLHPGDVARVEISPGRAILAAGLSWQGTSIPLVPLGQDQAFAAFFGIPREEEPGVKEIEITVTGRDGRVLRSPVRIEVLAKDFPVQRLTLPESKVTPDKEALARHRREQNTLAKVFSELRSEPLWQEGFVLPVGGELLSPFGRQRILNDKPRSPHSGVDLRASLGTPVAAAGGGVVVLAEEHFFAGKSVYIDHGMGIMTMYFHLSEYRVEEGDRVTTGQIIGLAGASGRATGAHLHWGARVHNVKVDPLVLPDVTKPGMVSEKPR